MPRVTEVSVNATTLRRTCLMPRVIVVSVNVTTLHRTRGLYNADDSSSQCMRVCSNLNIVGFWGQYFRFVAFAGSHSPSGRVVAIAHIDSGASQLDDLLDLLPEADVRFVRWVNPIPGPRWLYESSVSEFSEVYRRLVYEVLAPSDTIAAHRDDLLGLLQESLSKPR